jgi:hypothetical protein
MYSFDKMLYDLLYQQSIRFRLRHWGRMAKARPRLLGVIVALAAVRNFCKLFAPSKLRSETMLRWEREVQLRQKSAKAQLQLSLPGSAGILPASDSSSAGVPPTAGSESAIPGSAGVPPALVKK